MGRQRTPLQPVHIGPAVLFSAALLGAIHAPCAAQAAGQEARRPAPAAQAQPGHTQREAAVPDETADAAHPATAGQPPARTGPRSAPPLPPPYGPVLTPRGAAVASPAPDNPRREPAEVRDETDSGTDGGRQQPRAQTAPATRAQDAAQDRTQPRAGPAAQRQARRRHPAWQVSEPVPARPPAVYHAPVPQVPAAPQPVVPSSSISGSCQGGLCTDASGNTTTGSGPAAIGNGGRLCVRGTATVQCF